MTNNQEYHIPVMLHECIDALSINPDGIYVDVTFGGGGHSHVIFEKLSSKGRLIAFDQDPDARNNAWEAPNFDLIPANFSFMSNHLRLLGIKQVDGILADLGVSSHQFDEDARGFSFHGAAQLDMRMNQKGELTAKDVVNDYSERELTRIFKSYGEVSNARRLAETVVAERRNREIRTTSDLTTILDKCAPKHKEHKYYAQVFQAIRIEVNNELGALEDLLNQAENIMKPGGRFVVMSYHSLEDRLVKNFMKRGSLSGEIEKDFYGNVIKPFTELVRHPVIPSDEEIVKNTRARSAKLRIAERNG